MEWLQKTGTSRARLIQPDLVVATDGLATKHWLQKSCYGRLATETPATEGLPEERHYTRIEAPPESDELLNNEMHLTSVAQATDARR